MVTKSQYNKIAKFIGDTLANNILQKSVDNLSSVEFSGKNIPGERFGESKDKKQNKWTITNRGALSKSGYKKADRKNLKWTVGFDAPHAYDVNFGTPGGGKVSFEKIYVWSYQRKKEIKSSYSEDVRFPKKKDNPHFYRFWDKYRSVSVSMKKKSKLGKMGRIASNEKKNINVGGKKSISGKRIEKVPFVFAYYVWLSLRKNGQPPTFFFSDAVYTTERDIRKILLSNSAKMKTYVYDAGTGDYSVRGGVTSEG